MRESGPNEIAAAAPFSERDSRALLWLCVAAVCLRWQLVRWTPLPGVDASIDLWVAQRLAHGDFAALAAVWWRPWWALCIAPAVACGAVPLVAAQVIGCVIGGLAIWPVAIAAQRLREGAGVLAGVMALAAAIPAVGAAMASALPLAVGAVGLAIMTWVGGRRVIAVLLALIVAVSGVEHLTPAADVAAGFGGDAWNGLRIAWSLAGAFALLSVLPPRPRRIVGLWVSTVLVIVVAAATRSASTLLPTWSPLVAVLAGVGLGRWRRILAELALTAVIAVGFLTAWQCLEPRGAIVERLLGAHLATRLAPGRTVVSDLPRLCCFAGARPRSSVPGDALLQAAAAPETAFVVLGPANVNATVTSTLSGRFVRYQVPAALRDLVVDRRITVFARRE